MKKSNIKSLQKFRITRYKKLFPKITDELLSLLVESADRFLTINEANKFRDQNIKSKRKVVGCCEICHNDFTIGLTNWLNRKYKIVYVENVMCQNL